MNTDKIYAETIASEYSVKTTSKVVALKKLDRKVKLLPMVVSCVLDAVSMLIFGLGMCFALGALGSGGTVFQIIGAALGLVGIVGAGVSYPIYKKILEIRKSRYASDIIRLAREISREA